MKNTALGLAEEVQQVAHRCLKQLRELEKLGSVREILRQIDKDYVAPVNRRQRRSAAQRAQKNNQNMDVAELYSPPRITEMAEKMNMQAGWAIDFTQLDTDGK